MNIGMDIGSTTIKAVVLDKHGKLLFATYARHFSKIVEMSRALLSEIRARFPEETYAQLAISGSAGMGLAKRIGALFVQEVYATRICAGQYTKEADVIVELGGEDAKILFLTGLSDARMNGSCAGGTGAFIDQMATLLKLTPETLNEKAALHERVYPIASRCGVFAKSDIQPLLNQGARIEDVCASILYAVVNQTVAGLAQGRAIAGNVVYLGGPLTFMSELRRAFDDVLGQAGILPENSLYFVAIGAALYAGGGVNIEELAGRLASYSAAPGFEHTKPLFQNENEYAAFVARHARAGVETAPLSGFSGRAHLGVDAGSTTVKTALISEDGALLHTTYQPNSGNPVPLVQQALREIYAACPAITLASVTTTGYGEQLIQAAFHADFGVVETMAHALAAKHFEPDVDFIIDIGGQDMKCFRLENGIITDIFLNEACSSGCGSFLQTFAEAREESIEAFARRGLFGDAPVELGSRCTVFMNSSVKQAQKDGASVENIAAGLAISVVKNALYKVIRPSSAAELGARILVQGGTFLNDAVLRAFERELDQQVVRPNIAGLMGAFGAALYGRVHAGKHASSQALSRQACEELTHAVKTSKCNGCTNQCSLTVNLFSGGRKYISGNRCERPITNRQPAHEWNIYAYKRALLSSYGENENAVRGTVGMPMGLNFFELLPFFHTLFTQLGFSVVTSPPSTRALYFKGQATIPSDTVCYPAKLMHGHIAALCEREDVDAIFYPCMSYNLDEGKGDNHFNCPVVAYYPEVIGANCTIAGDKPFLYEYLGIHKPHAFVNRFYSVLSSHFQGISLQAVRKAAKAAYREQNAFMARIRSRTEEIIHKARANHKPIVVLCGRPYHVDEEVGHGIDKLIVGHGAAVISEDGVSHLVDKTPVDVLNQWTYHARLYAAAHYVTTQADMQLVQLVSFGCGLDAVTTDEVRAILKEKGNLYTQIKIDEITNLGAVNIRLRGLFAALEQASGEVAV